MHWDSLLGHQTQLVWFQNAIAQRRLATSFLFIGPDGIGKRTFAKLLSKSLLCRNSPTDQLRACGKCEDCVQVEASTHPDLIELSKPADKSSLPLDLLIGDQDHRMREGLCHDISLRPFGGRRKVAIIDDADYLNEEGANSLLKTLEEPPTDSILILIGTSLQRQLPTIRSRCQCVLFHPLSEADLATLLLRQNIVQDAEVAGELAKVSGGSLSAAQLLIDPELHEFRAVFLEKLAGPKIQLAELAKTCNAIIDAAGKEAKLKRDRMKLVMNFAAQFYRELTLQFDSDVGVSNLSHVDQPLSSALEQARRFWSRGRSASLACWDTCLRTMEHVDRNANQASLMEWWIAKLAEQSGC